jgi:hypothetical protein
LSANTISVRGDVITARGDVKVSVPAHDESEPPVVLDASRVTNSVKGIIVMEGFRVRIGSSFLTADRAVMPQGPHGETIFNGSTLTGTVRLHLPQGDLLADNASLHFKQKGRLLALVTANGSWVEAADQSSEKTKTRNGEALQIQYDIPNKTVQISSPKDTE